MSDSVKVSVILPNFNHYDFLEQRIQSVLNQTYQDFEIILLDDASTDNSRIILKNYLNHPKVTQLIYNEVNSGAVFKQWIKGFELAKGDYVWIAESDDYADPLFLETTIREFESNESLGMVFTDTNKVDSTGKSLGLVSKSKKVLSNLSEGGGVINKTNLSKYLLRKMVIVNASSVLFKKEALLKVDLHTLKEFKNTGDVFVYIGIALNYTLLFVPQPLNFMRLHAHSTTKINKKSGLIYADKFRMLDHYLEDFHKLKIGKDDVVYFFTSNIFFFVDYLGTAKISKLIKRLVADSFVSSKSGIRMNLIIVLYKKCTYKGKPHSVRMLFKYFLKSV